MTEVSTKPGTEPTTETEAVDAGTLAIRTGQGLRDLTDRQKAAFKAIVSFDPRDPTSWPHIEVFLELCAARGLNPWAREAHLIKRGKGDRATYAIQTGIDGYRKLANSSGRYHSAARVYWTGPDNDPEWWTTTEDEFGIMVKRRVWVDAWIWPDRNPAAARALIRHYDDHGELTYSDAVASWGMFAPYNPKWEGSGNNRRQVIDPETKRPVMELAEMWRKDGGAFMISKCAEALVLRKAFPAQTSGIYVDEEMHQADARAQDDAARVRVEAYERARNAQPAHTELPAPDGTHAEPPVHDYDAPVHDDVHDETQETHEPTPPVSEADRRGWLLDEIHAIAAIIGKPDQELVQSLENRLRVPLTEVAPDALVGALAGMRTGVADTLRQRGHEGVADAYASVPDNVAAPTPVLFGSTDLWEIAAPHTFTMPTGTDDSVCTVCDGYEDDPVHGGNR